MYKILVVLLFPFQVFSQNTIGFPDVINYSKQIYKAGLQNWDVEQDKNGKMYFANNEGLLCFDGKYWNNYPLPNKTNVRSVQIGDKNKIFVGGQDELGYFSPSKNGTLIYHSLVEVINDKERFFGDVWDIVLFKGDIYFRSTNKIFKYSNQNITTYTASNEWDYLAEYNGKLYANDLAKGLMEYENNIWKPVEVVNSLPNNDPVTSILSIGSDSAIITTLQNGLFILTGSKISILQSVNNSLFKNERIYSAENLRNGLLALGTNNNGVYIIDTKGNIVQHFTTKEGLQNNNVLSIFSDKEKNLWLGLDNGIDLITYNSAIKLINPLFQNGSGYTAIQFDSKLFLGTSNGLLSVPILPAVDLSFVKGNFSTVDNSKGQVWSLATLNNQLLIGHHEGAFILKNNTASPISTIKGFWNFAPFSNTFPTAQVVAGGYLGLYIFDYSNGNFISSKHIPGFVESSRYVVLDRDGSIWVSQPYHGVFKIVHNADDTYNSFIYGNKKGLPSLNNNHIFFIKGELLVGTEKGVYKYNKQTDSFESHSVYQKILGQLSIRYLKEDTEGNIWFIHEKKLGVIDFTKEIPQLIYLPELNNKMLSGFENIYCINNKNIFLGGEKGFYHINYEKYKQTIPKIEVEIRKLLVSNTTDSVLFGGYYGNENAIQEKNNITLISHRWKTIRFEFASAIYGIQSNLQYSYRLKGYDNNWSEWTDRTEKEYTNLGSGKFVFEVKVRNNLGTESAPSGYSFEILPPWYATILAKVFYFLFVLMGLYFLYTYLNKKFKLQQKKYEEEQKKLQYIHELELTKSSSDLITLQNEKLEAEISYKNSELASSAMHLVKKGELVNKIKGELAHIMKVAASPKVESELKKMIKSISEDDTIDGEWEKFAKHFDKVHSDFITLLKEKHPSISNNEIKLCAYLRMNLSTKEIAQLLNISVRGVEISRYRLRKKLELSTDVNLFNYLINFHT